jgi:IS5 family transposase
MLRTHFLQQWFNLSDPGAEEALCDSAAMRRFAGIDEERHEEPRSVHASNKEGPAMVFRNEGARRRGQQTKLNYAVVATAANLHDATILPDLLHGEETRAWGDQAYKVQTDVIRKHAPNASDFTDRRCRWKGVVDEVEKARNRTKSEGWAKVEHSIGVVKRVFGFVKVRYRGLEKNAHRLFVTCVLDNLFIARRQLLRGLT